jgi:AAA domain (dynein-related subfamily)
MDIRSTKLAISHIFKIGRTPHLIGKHGLGKSSVVAQWCKENGYKMVDVRLGQMADAGDIIGLPEFHTDSNGVKYTKYVLPDFFPREPKTVIFLDEINRASKDLLQAVFELIYDKRLKGVDLPADCHVIAASNPATDDYAVLDFSDSAFQDRFVHLNFSPKESEFVEYMKTKGYAHSGMLAFLTEDPRMMDDGNLQAVDLSFVKPSRRSWDAAFQIERAYDNGEMDKSMFMEIASGIVGSTATIAAIAYKESHVGSLKGADLIDTYHTGEIRSRLLKAVEKGRTDIIGNSLQDIDSVFKKRKGLTLQQGLNIIALAKDLSPEQTYTLMTYIARNHDCCNNVEGMDGGGNPDEAGLLNNDDLISVLDKTRAAREKAAKAAETAKAKKAKKKVETEEAPF